MDAQGKRHQWHDHWSIHTATSNSDDGSSVTPKASNTFLTESERQMKTDPSEAGNTPAPPPHTLGHYRVGVAPTNGFHGVVVSTPFAQQLSGGNQLEQSCWNKSRDFRQENQFGRLPVLARYPPKDFIRASDQLYQTPRVSEGAVPHVYSSHVPPEAQETPVYPSLHQVLPPHLRSRPSPVSPQDSALHPVPQNSKNRASPSKENQVPIGTFHGPTPTSQACVIPPHLRGASGTLPPAPRSRDASAPAPCSGANGAIGQNDPVDNQNVPSALGKESGTEIATKPLQSSVTTVKTQESLKHQHEPAFHEQRKQITKEPKHQGGFQEALRHCPPESSPKLLKEKLAENASPPGWKPTDRFEIRLHGTSSASTHRSLGSELIFEDEPIVPPGMGWEASMYDPTAPPDFRWGLPTEQPLEQDWNVTRRPREVIQSDPELSGSIDSKGNFQLHLPTCLRRWILGWVESIPGEQDTSFLNDRGHWRCDVDTCSGRLLLPIEYPESKPRKLPKTSLQAAFLTHNRPSRY